MLWRKEIGPPFLQRLQKKFQQLEEQISALTKQKAELELALSDSATYSDPKKFAATENSYQSVTKELEQHNKNYETLFEKILEVEEQLA